MATLTLVADVPRTFPTFATIETWAEEIATASGGAHSVRAFGPGELVPAFESFDAVSSGVADIALLTLPFYVSSLPQALLPMRPFEVETGAASARSLFTAFRDTPGIRNDLDVFGLTPLAAGYLPPPVIAGPAPLEGSADLLGQRFVVDGPLGPALDGLDALPVLLANAELFQAVRTGVVDGVIRASSTIATAGISGLVDVVVTFPEARGPGTYYHVLVVNSAALAAAPADLRALIEETSGSALSARLGSEARAGHDAALAQIGQSGTLITGDVADWTALREALDAEILETSTSVEGPNAADWFEAFGVSDGGGDGGVNPIFGSSDDDVITGTEGADSVIGAQGDDRIEGLGGNDTLAGSGGDDGLIGGEGDDLLFGEGGNDNVAGGTGDDTVTGATGDDFLGGGPGDDSLAGFDGDDTLGGGQDDDTVDGGAGDDVMSGGPGDDEMSGGDGADTMGGAFGNDTVDGGSGDDSLGGGTGRDLLTGGNGNDSLGGGEGNDTLEGGSGDDFLAGGGRNDSIVGGSGRDRVNPGEGNDTMAGGAGADTFVFADFRSGEVDRVLGFEDGIDRFFMVGVDNAPGSGVAGRIEALGITDVTIGGVAGVEMTYSGQRILVTGVSAAELGLADFDFL